MSSLFAELYLDEDVSALVAQLLRVRGFVVDTTQELGQSGRSDDAQLAYATSQGRVIVTHNRNDFAQLAQNYFDDGHSHCGIIVAVRRSPQELVARLMVILDQMTAEELTDQIVYI